MWPCCSPFKIFHKIFNEIASFGSVQLDPARLGSADVLNDFDAAFSRFFSLAFMQANCVSSEINKIVQLPFYILIWLNLNNADDTVQLRRQSELMLSHIRIGTYTRAHAHTHTSFEIQPAQTAWPRLRHQIVNENDFIWRNNMYCKQNEESHCTQTLSLWVSVCVCLWTEKERTAWVLFMVILSRSAKIEQAKT